MPTDIIQLPLSFITSIFALNVDVFPKNPETGETSWPIGQVSGYLCMSHPTPSPFYRPALTPHTQSASRPSSSSRSSSSPSM
jgi:hypothetical protein